MEVICKSYPILFKELEHLWMLVSVGGPGPNPLLVLYTAALLLVLYFNVMNAEHMEF